MKQLIHTLLAWCNRHELILVAVAGGLAAGIVYSLVPVA